MSDGAAGYWAERYARGDTPWDKAAAAPALREVIARVPIAGRVLVPGCGHGHDARALAALHGVAVTGLDLVPQAVAAARRLYGDVPGLEFVAGDFFALPVADEGAFDVVFEHTCLCAIDPAWRPQYAAAAVRALKPGGIFAGILFVDPDTDAGPPYGIAPEEWEALVTPALGRIATWLPGAAFPGREGRERIWIGRKR